MQFQADLAGITVKVSKQAEITAWELLCLRVNTLGSGIRSLIRHDIKIPPILSSMDRFTSKECPRGLGTRN
jgi:hypothetical protein